MPIMTFMTRYYHSCKNHFRVKSVLHNYFFFFCFSFFALTVTVLTSCEEDPTKIGTSILPGNDFVFINSTDTLSIWSYTMYNSSERTDNPSYSFMGQLNDPYFGTTTTEFVSQVRLQRPLVDQEYVIDSVKIFLELTVLSGSTDLIQTLRMTEIAEQIYIDSAYYSDTMLDTTEVGLAVNLPRLRSDTLNKVSVRLPNSFGEYILRDKSKFFYSNSQPDFRSYFKGLYFRLNPSVDPLLVTVRLAPSSSGDYTNYIIIYMKDLTGKITDYIFVLDPTNRNACFNRFAHDFSTADPDKEIKNINQPVRDTLSYLQYLNGVFTRIVIPGLENFKTNPDLSKIAVNKARLTVPIFFDGEDYTPSNAPKELRLRYRTKSGFTYDVPDYTYDPDFFDGKIDTIAKTYTFNIPNFVQIYLDDATGFIKPELEIYQPSGTRNAILRANDNSKPVKLGFSYTRY